MFGVHNRKVIKCLLKCLPTIVLLLFIVAMLVSLDTTHSGELKKSRGIKLLCAITFSCIGDGCLVFPKIFLVGVLSFAASLLFFIHVLEMADSITYISFEGILSGICIFFLAVLVVIMVMSASARSHHFPRIPRMVTFLILIYYTLLSTLLWSGLLLFLRRRDLVSAGAAVGAAMFYVSDLLIAASSFWTVFILQGRVLIMLTYYTALVLLTLSLTTLY